MKKILAISGAVILAIVILLLLPQVIWSNSFMPTETLNGVNVSWLSFDKAVSKTEEALSNYTLTLETLEGSKIVLSIPVSVKLNTSDIDLKHVFWLGRLIKGAEYNLSKEVSYDEAELQGILDSSTLYNLSNTVKSESAYISDTETLEIVPEVQGNEISSESLSEQLKLSIESLSPTLNLLDSGCYIAPEVTEEQIKQNLEQRGSAYNFTITYTFGDKTFKFNHDYLEPYIIINPDGTEGIKEEAISDFVSNMNSEISTLGRGLNFRTTTRGTVYVPGGNWGWWLDTSAVTANLKTLISEGKDATGEISWRQQAPKFGASEFDNYVEIDLTNQHLYLYKNNSLIGDWNIVSGLASDPNRKTPAGIYKLTYKEKNAVLRGEDYESPVTYWMPFNGGIGMHDASWRSSFGGSIYKYNGSHGCINMPLNGAKTVYEYIDSSYAIICYY